jgi:hypothetical protein
MLIRWGLGALAVLMGCSSSGASTMIDISAEARDAAAQAAAPTLLAGAKGVQALFVQEDPTVDINKTAGQNADKMAAQVMAKVTPCAGAQVTHAAGDAGVTVDFGTGCQVVGTGTLEGHVTTTVTKMGTTVVVNYMFTGVSVNGNSLDGTAIASTSDGMTYASTFDLTSGIKRVTFSGTATIDANGRGVTLSGTGGQPVSYVLAGVHHVFGACYADAGTMSYRTSETVNGHVVAVSKAIVFATTTPASGIVMVTVNSVGSTQMLPPYGTCPHS